MNLWKIKIMSYELKYLEEFLRRKNKIIKNNFVLFSRIESTLKILKTNPFYRSLQTHKITKSFGTCYSSRVMGDLRILWILILLLL